MGNNKSAVPILDGKGKMNSALVFRSVKAVKASTDILVGNGIDLKGLKDSLRMTVYDLILLAQASHNLKEKNKEKKGKKN